MRMSGMDSSSKDLSISEISLCFCRVLRVAICLSSRSMVMVSIKFKGYEIVESLLSVLGSVLGLRYTGVEAISDTMNSTKIKADDFIFKVLDD